MTDEAYTQFHTVLILITAPNRPHSSSES